MGDEMKQAETGMPSLTLEPELVMEQEKEPEVQAQLMEVTQESGTAENGTDCPYAGRTADGRKFCRKDRSGKSDTGYAVWSRNTEEDG